MKSHYLMHSFATAISDTIPTTIATATASSFKMIWNLFVFLFFPSKISWTHFAISACPRALSLPNTSGILPHSTADQKSCTNDPDSIHGSLWGVSSTNLRCFVPRACMTLLSSAFLASVHHPWHMVHATIAVLNLGLEVLSWNRFFAGCFRSLFTNPFPAFRALLFLFLFFSFHSCPPLVKTKVTSHSLHVTVMSCSGPSATVSVCSYDASPSVGTSYILST